MYSFDYERPSGVSEAASAIGEDDRFLAGGQTLIPTLKLRLAEAGKLVDLSRISDLKGISANGSELTIGAMTRHADVAASTEVKSAISVMLRCATAVQSGDRSRIMIRPRIIRPPLSAWVRPFIPTSAAFRLRISSSTCLKPHWKTGKSLPRSPSRFRKQQATRNSRTRHPVLHSPESLSPSRQMAFVLL